MLQSIALMLLLGMALGWLCKKVKLPGLVGMIATGMILGPYGLGWLDSSILDISSQLRRIALIIILLSRIIFKSGRFEKSRASSNSDVFCSGLL